jgi:hypothetical protein
MADELRSIQIHGFKTYYNSETRNGMRRLLEDLDSSEARPLFDHAKRNGSANFEDDNEGQYTLIYDRGKYTFTIIRRSH